MSYELETKKIDLDGGGRLSLKKKHYAVLYVELLHATQKAVNVLTRPYLTFPDDKKPRLTIDSEKQIKVDGVEVMDVDMAAINWDEVNDAIVVNQVKEWSFGPVDQEVLNRLPERIRARLVEECDRLYGNKSPLPKGGDGS